MTDKHETEAVCSKKWDDKWTDRIHDALKSTSTFPSLHEETRRCPSDAEAGKLLWEHAREALNAAICLKLKHDDDMLIRLVFKMAEQCYPPARFQLSNVPRAKRVVKAAFAQRLR